MNNKLRRWWPVPAVVLVVQAIQPALNNGSALTDQDLFTATEVPPTVSGILKKACYDCHSNHTNYPWYSHITPVNWWLKNHIDAGKEELNFSNFAAYNPNRQAESLKAVADEVDEGYMPLPSYLWVHKEARLSAGEKQLLVKWARNAAARHRAAGQEIHHKTREQAPEE